MKVSCVPDLPMKDACATPPIRFSFSGLHDGRVDIEVQLASRQLDAILPQGKWPGWSREQISCHDASTNNWYTQIELASPVFFSSLGLLNVSEECNQIHTISFGVWSGSYSCSWMWNTFTKFGYIITARYFPGGITSPISRNTGWNSPLGCFGHWGIEKAG